jgi:hypothetical protein
MAGKGSRTTDASAQRLRDNRARLGGEETTAAAIIQNEDDTALVNLWLLLLNDYQRYSATPESLTFCAANFSPGDNHNFTPSKPRSRPSCFFVLPVQFGVFDDAYCSTVKALSVPRT